MRKFICYLVLLSCGFIRGQVGIGTASPSISSALEISSTSKGILFPRMTQTQMNAVVSPATGLQVDCLDCVPDGPYRFNGTIWRQVGAAVATPVVTAVCNGFVTGSYVNGIATTGTFTVTLTNNSFSTATISFQNSDLVLSGVSGLSVTGTSPATISLTPGLSSTVTYTITGTPTAIGTLTGSWSKLSLSCSAIKAINYVSTNGTGIVTAYDCTSASAGTMTAGFTVSGVTQTITATVASVGTYDISAIVNGVTFSRSGTFAGTGPQTITLTAAGTPTTGGSNSFTLNTTPSCSFNRSINCGAYVSAGVFKTFMCHNLGADTSLSPDVPVQGIHGNYYQWGRKVPVADASTPSGPILGWDASSAVNGSWSEASKTLNDPCPDLFRVPTYAQWNYIATSPAVNFVIRTGTWASSSTNFGAAIHFGATVGAKSLTLPVAGYRSQTDGMLNNRGVNGTYWSSTEDSTRAWFLFLNSSSVSASPDTRAIGFSVRCISE